MQPVGLQEWIHKLEEGEGTRFIRLAFAMLALLGLAALWHIREAKGFHSIEAMDSAQLARNIARGRGYTTQFVRPLSLALLEEHGGQSPTYLRESHPDLANPPVYPVLLAGLMKILPLDWEIGTGAFWRFQPEVFIGMLNQILFFGALVLLFRLAGRLFDKAVASLAVVLMALTEVFWEFTTSGLSTMLLIVLFLLLANILVAIDEGAATGGKSKGWLLGRAALCGLIVGVMALTRYSLAWLILPVAGYLAWISVGARAGSVVLSLLAGLLVLAPWVARNMSVSGTLFGTAGFAIYEGTTDFPGTMIERMMPHRVGLELNKVNLQEYPRKLFLNGRDILVSELPESAGNWIAGLFLASLLIRFRNPALYRLKYFACAVLFLFLIVEALGRTALSVHAPQFNSENLLVIFTPLFFVFGSGLFYIFLDQVELPPGLARSAIITGFVAMLSLPLLFRLLPPRGVAVVYPPYYPPSVQHVSNWLQPGELMMTDMPWAVAWYGDRQAIWITLDYGQKTGDDFYRINDNYKGIKGIYLTPITTNSKFLTEMRESREGIWGKFYLDAVVMKNLPTGFPLTWAPPGLLPDMLFLSDRIRWRQ